MVRHMIATVCLIALAASTAQAQVKFEASVLGGYSWAEGVTGKDFLAPNGQTYNKADPTSSGMFGFSFGVTEGHGEYGFLYRRNMGQLQVSGTTNTTVGDMNTDNYHGYFAYYFGDPDRNVHVYAMAGAGMTHYSSVPFTLTNGQTGTVEGGTDFSPIFSAGVRARVGDHAGVRFGVLWTPTYLTVNQDRMWCDPNFGCYLQGNPQYANQVDFFVAFTYRFGGK